MFVYINQSIDQSINQSIKIMTGTTKSSNAIKQLTRDLKQLEQEPLIGANARPLDRNMLIWYGIVVGADGSPYQGVPIRFVLEFDDQYPDSAPKAFFDTYVRYINGASHEVNGRMAVCLNIFGNFANVHTEWKTTQGEGWSPAYTVSTILVSMQGLMMSDMLSTNPSDVQRTIDSAKNFKCAVTKHDGSDPKLWFPKVLLTRADLDLYYLENGIQTSNRTFNVLRDHYICYVKKSNHLDGAVLGYGINIDNPKNGLLSSPCEYLSIQAFSEGIRRSSTNKTFTDWIPVLVNSAQWKDIKKMFVENVEKIAQVIGIQKMPIAHKVVKVCSSIMTQLVVEIMNNKNNLNANDKFVDGYFAIYRLMSQFSVDDLEVLKYVDQRLGDFIKSPDKRSKTHCPNLGELLIYLTISKKYTWNDIGQAFVNENDARGFFWYAVGNYNSPARFPELADTRIVDGRAEKVFQAVEISRNLVMFQVRFSQVTRLLTPELMDSNQGLAPDQIRDDLKSTYNSVSKVKDWNGYFRWLNLPETTDGERSRQLVQAVEMSAKQGYHKTGESGSSGSSGSNRRRY